MKNDFSTLKRKKLAMSDDIKEALVNNDLYLVYKERPPYQQNDYIGWIKRAKRNETKEKRLLQMLEELKDGDRYMKMRWAGKRKIG